MSGFKKWKLGWRDRFHGHGDFCVIDEDDKLVIDDFTMSKELCEQIVNDHNIKASECISKKMSVKLIDQAKEELLAFLDEVYLDHCDTNAGSGVESFIRLMQKRIGDL